MNLVQLKEQVLFQTGNTADDLGDLMPHLTHYLNEGYDRMTMALYGKHVEEAGEFPPLSHDKSQPLLPGWAHRSLADWASWMICRNGPAARQTSGWQYRRAFDEAVSRARLLGPNVIRNIPR